MNDIRELIEKIYTDIRSRNTDVGPKAIPMTDSFYDELANSYNLIPFGIPKLIKILVDSHKIFSFPVVEADRSERIRRIDGLVVAEGNIINQLFSYFEDELITEYSNVFHKKINSENILKDIVPVLKDYNNQKLGKVTNIVLNLIKFTQIIEYKIMEYGPSWQNKQLTKEVEGSDPISAFINSSSERTKQEKKEKTEKKPDDNNLQRRAVDSKKYKDFKKYSSKHSIEKTIAVYGVEFYTRVCFRDYQFSLIQGLIKKSVISDSSDLLIIKKFLAKERANSDRDLRLQEFAADINKLEKLINEKLKQEKL